jgi:hypothetical protein
MAFLLDVKRRDLIINPNTAEHDVTVSGVKKKHPSKGRSFSCFSAHMFEQDLF